MNKIIVVLLALVCATLASLAHAEFKWQHFGADPYASSRDEAMRTRESAFSKLDLRKPVVKLLVEATQKPGEKVRLVNGDKLSAMMSKGGIVHRNVIVASSRSRLLAAAWSMRHRRKSGRSRGRERSTSLFSLKSVTTGARLPARLSKKCVELVFQRTGRRTCSLGIGTTIGPLLQTNATHNGKATDCGRRGMGNVTFAFPAIGYIRGILGVRRWYLIGTCTRSLRRSRHCVSQRRMDQTGPHLPRRCKREADLWRLHEATRLERSVSHRNPRFHMVLGRR